MRRRGLIARRRGLIALLSVALVALLPVASSHAGGAGGAAPPPSAAALGRLHRQLTKALAGSGSAVGLLVERVAGGQVLFSRNADVARPPASVEKLYTTLATLNLLGPSTRLETFVFGEGRLGRGGVWHGNLFLRGGGDPTLGDGSWNHLYEDGYGPTASELAEQLRADGIRRVTGHLWGDESMFDSLRGGPLTHDRPDLSDYGGELSALVYDHGMSTPKMSPPVFAAHELALTLRALGIRVAAAGRTRTTPTGAVALAHVVSPPLSVLVRLMDVPSDDLIADLLAKQLGARLLGTGTLAAGAQEITRDIARRYGLHPLIFDGSGLDRADRSTPAEIVSLLRQAYGSPNGRILYTALPVVGEQGTVQDIGLRTPARARCVAKTGTLNGVTNLAGYCQAKGGVALAFALLLDGPSNDESIPVLNRVVGAIARY